MIHDRRWIRASVHEVLYSIVSRKRLIGEGTLIEEKERLRLTRDAECPYRGLRKHLAFKRTRFFVVVKRLVIPGELGIQCISHLEFLDAESHNVHYLRQPFSREPDFGVTSVNYDFAELLNRAEAPS